ncbi:MAG: dihydrofolate reductase family protein [Acidimicrobiales bacterium]
MRQLLPHPMDDVDPLDLYLADERPPHADRPWLMTNMIASIDGATTIDGVSGGLGGAGDAAVFRAVRASCDWVLVASGTAVAERYRMPRTSDELITRRSRSGRTPAPGLAIVTASGRIDPSIPAFADRTADQQRPLVITGQDADGDALSALDAELVRLPGASPEPHAVLAELMTRGARVVLAEGGPSFNGLLHRAEVIDEMCLSLAPTIAGGESERIVANGPDLTVSMHLDRLLEEDGTLFARYVRA